MPRSDLDRTLVALADPARRNIVELLRHKPHRAGELADALSLNRPRMSQHLRVLRQSGLIEAEGVEHDARVRVFRLRLEPFVEIRNWLQEIEHFWTMQLAAFKQHAERRMPKQRR